MQRLISARRSPTTSSPFPQHPFNGPHTTTPPPCRWQRHYTQTRRCTRHMHEPCVPRAGAKTARTRARGRAWGPRMCIAACNPTPASPVALCPMRWRRRLRARSGQTHPGLLSPNKCKQNPTSSRSGHSQFFMLANFHLKIIYPIPHTSFSRTSQPLEVVW